LNALLFGLVAIAIIAIELLKGGVRPVFSLPAYGILALAAILSFFHRPRFNLSKDARFCLAASAVFFGYVLGRAAVSPDAFVARQDLYLLAGALMLYLLVALHLISSKVRMWLVVLLLALGMAHGVVGVIQFIGGENYTAFHLLRRADYGLRASGFYNYPNFLAGFLEVTLLLGLAVAWWSRWPIYGRLMCGWGAVMCLGALLITGSRGGYLSVACGLVAFAVLSALMAIRRGPLIVAMFAFVLVLGFGAKKLLSAHYFLEQRSATMTMDVGDSRRLMGHAALKQFRLSPVAGTGSGTYLYYGRQLRSPAFQLDPLFAHNDYLQLLAEYGVLGFAGLLLFFYAHISSGVGVVYQAVERSRNDGETQSNSLALTIGALSGMAAIGAHSMLDFNLHNPANTLLMAFVFGVLANPGGEQQPAASEERRGFDALRLLLPALGIAVAALALPKFPAEFFGEKARMLLSTVEFMKSAEVAKRAADYAREGLFYDPRNPELHSFLGLTQAALARLSGDPTERERYFKESIAAYQNALALAPQDRAIMLRLASSLDALKRFDESEPFYQRALELDPNSADVHWARGAHYQARGDLQRAETSFRIAYKLGSPGARMRLEQLGKQP
jgi:O-antigen ligase/cytochrome c-type biogenesis protein CcmH/NrfG